MINDIPVYEINLRLGDDLFIPFEGVDVLDNTGAVIESVNLTPSQVLVLSEKNGINWTSASGNIIADGANCALSVGYEAIKTLGRGEYNPSVIVIESNGRRVTYADLKIKVE